ncbi:hypothetical protein [Nocardiopsis lambiniae]|uniref:PEGA domain-containing protein n=1 Tax=Nocardiopsis lambiniae TaxID=3075539 RepID=A0ABU2M928_9ACTN|nr:hypothetical protein [Nocardiopsis sp. DSM 44743]MDT0329110.1 hypothetical protein [Nocardiopsis sp. DSM 44743]
MLTEWKRRRAAKRVRPGDGRALRPFRWWQLLSGRKLFHLPLVGEGGRRSVYTVDVRHWGRQGGDEGKAHLYLDGAHRAESTLPAGFPVEGGTIEVALSGFGLKRAHYVTAEGADQRLVPDPRSAVGRRLRFDREHPVVSRCVGAVSVVLLVIGVGLNVLQLLEPIAGIPPVVERFGRFESPIHLPLWLNLAFGFGAAVAGMERGLRLRYHWLLDAAGN